MVSSNLVALIAGLAIMILIAVVFHLHPRLERDDQKRIRPITLRGPQNPLHDYADTNSILNVSFTTYNTIKCSISAAFQIVNSCYYSVISI